MDIAAITSFAFGGAIIALVVIITIKMVKQKQLPNSYYTPFDYITGHSPVEFQEQKIDKEEDDEQGDDKDKNGATSPITSPIL